MSRPSRVSPASRILAVLVALALALAAGASGPRAALAADAAPAGEAAAAGRAGAEAAGPAEGGDAAVDDGPADESDEEEGAAATPGEALAAPIAAEDLPAGDDGDAAEAPDGSDDEADAGGAPELVADAHIQDVGWRSFSGDGATIGTTGRCLRLEALRLRVSSSPHAGGIRYAAHVQDVGWQDARSDGALAGTTGEAKRLEALRVELTGALAERYDVWYRLHVQDAGWLSWASNGADAGSQGLCLRVEALQIKIVPKGAAAPGPTATAFLDQGVGKIGWQNPSWLPQASCKTVTLPAYAQGHGRFSYVSPSAITVNATREQVVEAFITRARQYIGTRFIEPYSCAPGDAVDCSGLVLQCLYACGVDMEHAAGSEKVGGYNPWNHLTVAAQTYNSMRWYENGAFMAVGLGQIQRGDLVYYRGHVAIYLGSGRIIDSWPGRGVTERGLNAPGRPIGAQRPFV